MAGGMDPGRDALPFNDWRRGASATSMPPFAFDRVTLRYFPLSADPRILQRFCDDYLNLAPEIAAFRPAMPFVLLCVVDYGRMSQEAGNVGWTSQNELFFTVPVEWYERRQGRWVLRDLAQVSPFIFVDNASSQVEGREVFGWPKMQGWFSPTVNPWAKHPLMARELLTLTTRVVDQVYARERLAIRDLLVIQEAAAPSFTTYPPEPAGPLNPFVGIPEAFKAWSDLVVRLWGDASSLFRDRPWPMMMDGRQAGGIGQLMGGFVRSLHANTINLKQVRDAEAPDEICYQALTRARMTINRLRQGGMLGDGAVARGDPSGGFEVRLRRFGSQPIVETLGLHVHAEMHDAVPAVACLKPVLPFWQELDLTYEAGENICWRSRETAWTPGDPARGGGAAVPKAGRPSLRFNTTGSLGFQVATGPFALSNTTFRVLPLLAWRDKLTALCDASLNEDKSHGLHFEVLGRHVYLLVTTFGDMTSKTNDFGLWTGTQINFSIPVRWRQGDAMRVGYFSPFVFTDSDVGANTARELFGWTATEGQISAPPDPWASARPALDGPHTVLSLKTLMYPELHVDQEGRWAPLLEIVQGDSALKVPPTRNAGKSNVALAQRWAREVRREIKQMAAEDTRRTLARLELRAGEAARERPVLDQVSLKQFRDAGCPQDACYQALVNVGTALTWLHESAEIAAPLQVRINRFASQPIVDMLGLVVAGREGSKEGVAEYLVPVRPYYLHADIETTPAENLCWRAGSRRWWVRQTSRSEARTLAPGSKTATLFSDGLDPRLILQAAARRGAHHVLHARRDELQFAVRSDWRDANDEPLFKTRLPGSIPYWLPKMVSRGD